MPEKRKICSVNEYFSFEIIFRVASECIINKRSISKPPFLVSYMKLAKWRRRYYFRKTFFTVAT